MSDSLLRQDRGPGAKGRFVTTHWSVVRRAGAGDSDDAQMALGRLIETYWYPLYAFARRRGHGDHDAMDVTQGFFAHLLAGSALGSVAPEKGRFRSFLLASFTHFMANEHRAAQTVRRGGGIELLSIADDEFQTRYENDCSNHETPELLFQRSWVESLLTKVAARLADEYRAAGRSELFGLEPHLSGDGSAVSRPEIGRRLSLSIAAVSMSLCRMRRRYRELLREEVALTVHDPGEIDDELRSLMSIISAKS